ncbi:AMP-binding protein [Mycobacterium sp.]|uniref:AMP-binding protein n=1 Tax=Mycobacterium sp. TaxID=1785 RepID=UPI002CF11021|nr:AMP-binding protein [Mycobacterium sp.]HKP41607.1 AMP-binding protein [Mycobacterium sp.]
MSIYADAPWRALYASGQSPVLDPPHRTMLEAFSASVQTSPKLPVLRYFDSVLTLGWLNDAADALACALIDRGFGPGDRLALYTQNNPPFVIGLIAAWKAGGCAVPVNPMNKERELAHILTDSGATALLCLDDLYASVVDGMLSEQRAAQLDVVITTSAGDFQTRNDKRVLSYADPQPLRHGRERLTDVLDNYAGRRPARHVPQPDDVAVLTYTSGTTGVPKGAMNTHRAMSFNSYTCRQWMGLRPDDVIMGIAPLFHITGLVAHIGVALVTPCPLVLAHRFHPQVVLDALAEHRPTFAIAAITAFNSLLSASQRPDRDFASLRTVFSGGAPIAPAIADEFRRRTGCTILNIYGLTETTSPSHATPMGATAPVDPLTGALSVGVPVFNTAARILDDAGSEVGVGEIGEIAIRGPQVVPGYWNRPAETAEAIVDGELRTGDIGYMNDAGWFFVIDRKKDMINASGYKVWPREVEDVLCAHPAVREAAVIGVADPYRGETVKAFVSLGPGINATEAELIEFCKDNMAAYKYPRTIDILDELPKTLSGKILRRELRDRSQGTSRPPAAAISSRAGHDQ